jgi:hypothetical protein
MGRLLDERVGVGGASRPVLKAPSPRRLKRQSFPHRIPQQMGCIEGLCKPGINDVRYTFRELLALCENLTMSVQHCTRPAANANCLVYQVRGTNPASLSL